MTALVVEDDAVTRGIIARVLRSLCVSVRFAASAEEVRGFGYDLFVIDDILPGRSGYWLLREVRGRTEAPVVMVATLRSGCAFAMNAGADAFIHKPFRAEELREVVSVLVG